MAGGDNGPNLNHLLGLIQPAVHACEGHTVNDTVKKNAQMTVEELKARSEIIAKAAEGDLQIVPAYYTLGSGQVTFLD